MLVDHGRVRTFADGHTIFNEGDPGREMYVIQEGAVKISAMSQGARSRWTSWTDRTSLGRCRC